VARRRLHGHHPFGLRSLPDSNNYEMVTAATARSTVASDQTIEREGEDLWLDGGAHIDRVRLR